MRRHSAQVALVFVTCCAAPQQSPRASRPSALQALTPDASRRPHSANSDVFVHWALDTRSPNRPKTAPVRLSLVGLCGDPDERLDQAAEWLLDFRPWGAEALSADRLSFVLRAAGTPYVRPVAWRHRTRSGAESDLAATLGAALQSWVRALDPMAARRCGIAERTVGEQHEVLVVAGEVHAELVRPLPTRVHVGKWLDFEAELKPGVTMGRVLLLGPSGEPQVIPTSQEGRFARARFAAAEPGRWLVQLVAEPQGGPRPVLEALIYADTDQETHFEARRVPGLGGLSSTQTPDAAVKGLVDRTRIETGRPALRRDPRLDELALEHAISMRRTGQIGHDVGEGTTHDRLERVGQLTKLLGENVVHAADAARAHRALWDSPSHRANFLHRGFERFGLGVVQDRDGSLWICEIFASER